VCATSSCSNLTLHGAVLSLCQAFCAANTHRPSHTRGRAAASRHQRHIGQSTDAGKHATQRRKSAQADPTRSEARFVLASPLFADAKIDCIGKVAMTAETRQALHKYLELAPGGPMPLMRKPCSMWLQSNSPAAQNSAMPGAAGVPGFFLLTCL
jgi:hypothetical protein